MACEIRGKVEGSINDIALHDFAVMKEFFDFDLHKLEEAFSVTGADVLMHYEAHSSRH